MCFGLTACRDDLRSLESIPTQGTHGSQLLCFLHLPSPRSLSKPES